LDENLKFKQPVLDRNTDFKLNLGFFMTQETLDGKPILWVDHNENRDWQFHSDQNSDLESVKWAGLESRVNLDPTLNEIYYLNFGQSATRETATSS
jgi:hypothetical protein